MAFLTIAGPSERFLKPPSYTHACTHETEHALDDSGIDTTMGICVRSAPRPTEFTTTYDIYTRACVEATLCVSGWQPMNGTVVFSVDAELAWGTHDLHPLTEAQQRRVEGSRESWQELLRLFEAYGIPATWAVVGHLLTSDTDYRSDYPYRSDWFERPDSGMVTRPTHWLGRDLVEAVDTASVNNELASHSFSHVPFTDVSEEVAAAECELARAVGEEFGVEFTSFVFPRNRIAHRSTLTEYGFDCYRGHRPDLRFGVPGLRGLRMVIGGVSGKTTPPTVTPVVDEHGLVNVPASLFLGGFRGSLWTTLSKFNGDPVVTLAKRGIDRACERDELFHMWLHPHDLTDDRFIRRVREILDYVSMKENRDEASVRTMGEVAATVTRNQPPASHQSEHSGQTIG